MNYPDNKEKTFVSFVVCASPEETSAEYFLKDLYLHVTGKFESWEIIVVNNGGSSQMVKSLQTALQSCGEGFIVVSLPWIHDLELAMLAGTDLAVGDFVFEIESTVRDWPFEILFEMYAKCLEGFDIVSASSNRPRKWASLLFYYILNKWSYLKLDLTTEKLRIVSRRALNAVLSAKETVRYRKALYQASGFAGALIAYEPISKTRSKPPEGFIKRLGLAFDVLISFSNIGFRLALILCVIFFIVSLGIGIYAINSYLFRKTIASGWTTLALFLSFGFSGIFLVLGLLGKYLSIALVEIQNRPPYRVTSIIRIQQD